MKTCRGHGIDHWPAPPAVPAEFMVAELPSPVKPCTARTTQISNASSATILCRSDDMPVHRPAKLAAPKSPIIENKAAE